MRLSTVGTTALGGVHVSVSRRLKSVYCNNRLHMSIVSTHELQVLYESKGWLKSLPDVVVIQIIGKVKSKDLSESNVLGVGENCVRHSIRIINNPSSVPQCSPM